MVERAESLETFADRFKRLKGERSYDTLSAEIKAQTGVSISAQAMHKWIAQNGGITLDNARVVARFFAVSPAWLLFGEGTPPLEQHLEDTIRELPEESQQQVLDFIGYKFERAEGLIASEKLASYMQMIERFKQDLDGRRDD